MNPLPDPFLCFDGTLVSDSVRWKDKRRPELLAAFSSEVYGQTPLGRPKWIDFEVRSVDPLALDGAATRKEVVIRLSPDLEVPSIRLLVHVPNADSKSRRGKRPAFLGLNFNGNHTIDADPGITATGDAARGSDASKWQIGSVLARGYATASIFCGDLCPDRPDGLTEGVMGWLGSKAAGERGPDAWGALGAWAWGLSRALDCLEADPDVDASRVIVHGHSRMGKAALWAGAQDERFAIVVSNDSGCGGASLGRHVEGESIAAINGAFPHWFCRNFRKYNGDEAALPVDQHELLALIAPRPLYVASAEDDDWADPGGEFVATREAGSVYRLFGLEGLGVDRMPPVNHPVGNRIRYHIRTGPHDMTAYDWAQYLDFADEFLAPPSPS